MIYSLPPDADAPSAAAFTDLREYIEHKIGMTIEEIKADSPERFRVIEEEAVRDIVVMTAPCAFCPGLSTIPNASGCLEAGSVKIISIFAIC